MADSTILREETSRKNQLLNDIKKLYTMSNPIGVENFLDKHQEIASLVFEAYAKIREYFPSESLELELISDITLEGGEELFVYIWTSLSVEDASQKLTDFDEQWFLDQLDRTDGLFNLDVRFYDV